MLQPQRRGKSLSQGHRGLVSLTILTENTEPGCISTIMEMSNLAQLGKGQLSINLGQRKPRTY